ncbi:MAG: hypothetical protein U0797_01045 [Gemmataceae bacterium]
MIEKDIIRAAGEYLLDVLEAEKSVRYGRFLDDAPGADVADANAIRRKLADESDWSWYREVGWPEFEDLEETAHEYVNFAAWELESRGLVRLTFLEGPELADETQDFRIDLTPSGDKFLAEAHGRARAAWWKRYYPDSGGRRR